MLASRSFGSRSEALRAELAIKRLPKERKLVALQSADLLASPDITDATAEQQKR